MSSTTATQTTTNKTFPLNIPSPPSQDSHKTVPAILHFFEGTDDGGPPYSYVETPPEGVPRTNTRFEIVKVLINDIRGRESTFNIDINAFLPVRSSDLTKTINVDFTDTESIKQNYYPEVEQVLLQNLPGSPNRVFIFDHTVREQVGRREPVMRTHIDQTTNAARERVRFHIPNEAETLLKSRVRLVNVWRPINGSIESSPLAVADSSTVADSQILGVQHRYPSRTGETAAVRHSDITKWWFWSGMRDDERLLLQCYDSQSGTRAPHSAFKLPGEGEDGWKGKPRESIEVRALVFG